MSDRLEEIVVPVDVTAAALAEAVSQLTYEDIIRLVLRVDQEQMDSAFTDMLKEAVGSL
jgi:hypothetical protein